MSQRGRRQPPPLRRHSAERGPRVPFSCQPTGEEEPIEREQYVVWITTRRIKPGTYEEFRRAWRPKEFPAGMTRAYECFSAERNEVVGISVWDSAESRERYRASEIEAERRQAMAPYVEAESSGVYLGRELQVPK